MKNDSNYFNCHMSGREFDTWSSHSSKSSASCSHGNAQGGLRHSLSLSSLSSQSTGTGLLTTFHLLIEQWL